MITLEIFAAFIIWLISLTGGYFAFRINKQHQHSHFLHIAEAFAGGIFLGAAFFHMLPDAESAFRLVTHIDYPLANLICVISFCLLFFIEQVTKRIDHKESAYFDTILPLLLTLLISIHALSEGIALGINQQLSNILLIFIAIAVHKGSEGFAVGLQLLKSKLFLRKIIFLFAIFSLMSPLGVMLGISIHYFLHGYQSELLTGFFNAFAAGSFLYIATLHKLYHHHEQGATPLTEFTATLIGLALMATVAIWL